MLAVASAAARRRVTTHLLRASSALPPWPARTTPPPRHVCSSALATPRRPRFAKTHSFPTPPTLSRHLSTTSSPSLPVIADPTRADLFYHLLAPPTSLSQTRAVYALSFLPTLPAEVRVDSPAIVGWLPAEEDADGAVAHEDADTDAGLNDFKENPSFRALVQDVIGAALDAGADEIQTNGALQLGDGWMHVHDERNPPPLGRIGDPDDILGTVLVQGGKIDPGTYHAMPAYRLATADGVLHLTPGLARAVHDRCAALVAHPDTAA